MDKAYNKLQESYKENDILGRAKVFTLQRDKTLNLHFKAVKFTVKGDVSSSYSGSPARSRTTELEPWFPSALEPL